MKTLNIWMLLCLSLCASVAFARKGYVEQKIYVTAFDELEISGTYVAAFDKSDKYEIVLEVPEELMTYARTRVVNKKVVITFDMDRMSRKEQQYLNGHRPYVRIKAPAFRKIDLSGATSMDLKGTFNLGDVKLDLSGASNFDAVALKAKRMKVDLSGASNIRVSGLITDDLHLDISGASHCYLHSAEVVNMKVDLSGASHLDMKTFAKYADVDVSGVSHCNWEPLSVKVGERLDIDVSGMSKVDAAKVRFRKTNSEISDMSKLKINREKR